MLGNHTGCYQRKGQRRTEQAQVESGGAWRGEARGGAVGSLQDASLCSPFLLDIGQQGFKRGDTNDSFTPVSSDNYFGKLKITKRCITHLHTFLSTNCVLFWRCLIKTFYVGQSPGRGRESDLKEMTSQTKWWWLDPAGCLCNSLQLCNS